MWVKMVKHEVKQTNASQNGQMWVKMARRYLKWPNTSQNGQMQVHTPKCMLKWPNVRTTMVLRECARSLSMHHAAHFPVIIQLYLIDVSSLKHTNKPTSVSRWHFLDTIYIPMPNPIHQLRDPFFARNWHWSSWHTHPSSWQRFYPSVGFLPFATDNFSSHSVIWGIPSKPALWSLGAFWCVEIFQIHARFSWNCLG